MPRAAPPVFGADPVPLAALFDEELPFEDDDEYAAFGVLEVVHGWVGAAGPGLVVRVAVRTELEPDAAGLEIRWRQQGRYVRTPLRRYGDKDRDLRVAPELEATDDDEVYVATGFVPYAAFPDAVGRDLVAEAQLLEDGDPIEERLWRFPLPAREERLTEGPLGAVAAVAVRVLGDAGPVAGAIAAWFRLDADGRRALGRMLALPVALDLDEAAEALRRTLAPPAFARALGLIAEAATQPEQLRFLHDLGERLGRAFQADPELAAHFLALEVPPTADWETVRAAYRRLARQWHPDRAGLSPVEQEQANERMKKLNRAYEVLARALRQAS